MTEEIKQAIMSAGNDTLTIIYENANSIHDKHMMWYLPLLILFIFICIFILLKMLDEFIQ